jgi:hypothetical protein
VFQSVGRCDMANYVVHELRRLVSWRTRLLLLSAAHACGWHWWWVGGDTAAAQGCGHWCAGVRVDEETDGNDETNDDDFGHAD